MSQWWTYRLADFLMFSPTTYWRLVERYNRETWPLQVLMVTVGATLLWWAVARRPMADRAAASVLALVWLWVGWAFHWQRYATINWAAEYVAVAFAVQAMLLLALAVIGPANTALPGNSWARAVGLTLTTIGVLLYPFVDVVLGSAWPQSEVFGMMPDPTALATLGLLLAVSARYRVLMAIIPVLSLLMGAATWWLLQE
jgi:Family of unknown function (DUF6064)